MPPPRQNTEAELDAFADLCDRLGGFDDRLSGEFCDGFLTALAAGPRRVEMDEWLPALTGDAWARAIGDPEDDARARAVLQARMAVLRDQLDPESLLDDPDHLRLAPLMLAWDDAARDEAVAEGAVNEEDKQHLVTGAVWVAGFYAAIEAFRADWVTPDDDEEAAYVEDLLKQVDALALAEGSDELKAHVAAVYKDEPADRERLIDEACFAVQDLRLWWVDHAPRPETRRVDKQPGRNDPCPCGSGKKFKRCHGMS